MANTTPRSTTFVLFEVVTSPYAAHGTSMLYRVERVADRHVMNRDLMTLTEALALSRYLTDKTPRRKTLAAALRASLSVGKYVDATLPPLTTQRAQRAPQRNPDANHSSDPIAKNAHCAGHKPIRPIPLTVHELLELADDPTLNPTPALQHAARVRAWGTELMRIESMLTASNLAPRERAKLLLLQFNAEIRLSELKEEAETDA